MRLLVCGDREWSDRDILYGVLDELNYPDDPVVIIEGEARGADTMARQWAESVGVVCEPYPAAWKEHGRSAGPIRNNRMLTIGKPDLVVAFHDDIAHSKGTKHMVKIARENGLPVYLIGKRFRHFQPPDLQNDQ